MKRASIITAVFLLLFTGCTISKQKEAQAAVSLWQGTILRHLGEGYKPVWFGTLEPIYTNAPDSTIIGFYIDHKFTAGVNHSIYNELSVKRYYFTPDLRIVTAAPLYHNINSADSVARAILTNAAK